MATFTPEYMKQFEKEHKKFYPDGEPSKGGWPDAGDGRYSDKLPYKKWVEFKNAIRVHENFVEQLPLTLTFICCGAFVVPQMAMYVAWLNVMARIIYTVTYITGGSDNRVIGVISGAVPLNILGLTTAYSLIKSVI